MSISGSLRRDRSKEIICSTRKKCKWERGLGPQYFPLKFFCLHSDWDLKVDHVIIVCFGPHCVFDSLYGVYSGEPLSNLITRWTCCMDECLTHQAPQTDLIIASCQRQTGILGFIRGRGTLPVWWMVGSFLPVEDRGHSEFIALIVCQCLFVAWINCIIIFWR